MLAIGIWARVRGRNKMSSEWPIPLSAIGEFQGAKIEREIRLSLEATREIHTFVRKLASVSPEDDRLLGKLAKVLTLKEPRVSLSVSDRDVVLIGAFAQRTLDTELDSKSKGNESRTDLYALSSAVLDLSEANFLAGGRDFVGMRRSFEHFLREGAFVGQA